MINNNESLDKTQKEIECLVVDNKYRNNKQFKEDGFVFICEVNRQGPIFETKPDFYNSIIKGYFRIENKYYDFEAKINAFGFYWRWIREQR